MTQVLTDWAQIRRNAKAKSSLPVILNEEWRYSDGGMWSGYFPKSGPATLAVDAVGSIVTHVVAADDLPISDTPMQWGDFCNTPSTVAALAAVDNWLVVTGEGDITLRESFPTCAGYGTLIHAAPGVTIRVSFDGLNSNSNTLFLCVLDKQASVIVNDVRGGSGTSQASTWWVNQDSDSRFVFTGVDTTSEYLVRSIRVQQVGDRADTQFASLALGAGASQQFTHTHIDHLAQSGRSSQLIKTIMSGESLSEFKGTVHVAPGAQLTDSIQSNQNMILSDTARALSRPQLSIFADNVKCAHGATMSQLNPETVMYLQSRGLSAIDARSVLMAGFADDVVDRMSSDTLKHRAKTAVVEFFTGIQS